ncbi:MAG: aldo/keto reductase [Candidatus Nitrosocaldaceae archaeon]|nr:MAG: aldo/keto reductase [Candidatus Nitrosocaldaceae archaeon]GIU72740.1 MAG: aldo/keto reductase [Candidatus Nitrosocaldaceae archaeon]
MIEGYATKEGTKRFKDRFNNDKHFRLVNELYLTSIGMGTYLGTTSKEEDRMIIDAIKLSVSNGAINVIDTAINYRSQKSERAIRRAVEDMIDNNLIRRDEIFISTKNGYITDDGDLDMDIWQYIQTRLINTGIIKPEDISSGYHCMKISYLEDQLERSRRNLGLETIDLLYLHNAIESQVYDVGRDRFMQMLKDVFEFYEEKRMEGKIRYYGLATWNCFRVKEDHIEYLNLYDIVKMAESIKKDHGFKFIQLPFNLAMPEALTLKNQHIDNEQMNIIDAADRLGIGIFTSVPLMQGKILDRIPEFANIKSAALRCLQFARSAGVIPLVGQKRLEHVKENIKIAEIETLSKEEFKQLFATD